jgi:hypothetical protein
MRPYVYGGTEYDPERPKHWAKSGPKPRTEMPLFDYSLCGTRAGWRQHGKHKTPRCKPCQEAQNVYQRAYRAAQRKAA